MLVGRGAELERVRTCIADTRPVVIAGVAGIGKSTLARAALGFFGDHREGGALASLAWSPLLVFRRVLQANPPELPADVAGTVMGQASTPLLLDDLQWADDASLETLALLVGQLPIVTTVRTGEPRSEEVLTALELVGATRIDLEGLDDEPAAALAALLHPELTGAARDHLVEVAAGNPLLLGELPRGPGAAPGLVSTLLGRMRALDPAARSSMERLAVLGRPATAALLGEGAADLPSAGLATVEDGHYEVHHGLLAEVIVDELGGRADEVRRELVPLVDLPERAHLLAAAGDRAAARVAALEAADAETDRRGRASMLALAVDCAPDLDPRNRIAAARLFTALSDPGTARTLCAVPGRDDLEPVLRGGLYAAEAEAAWMEGRADDMSDLIARALADLEGTGTAFEAAALAGSTVIQTFVDLDGRPALARARRAVELADEVGEEQGYTRTRLASVLLTAGEPGWAERYEEVIDRALADDDPRLRRTAVTSLVLGRWITGDVAAAQQVALAELEVAPSDGFDEHWLSVASYAAILGLLAGREREELIAEFAPLLTRWGGHRARPFLESAVVLALADLGRHLATEEQLAASSPPGLDAQSTSILGWARIEAAWLAGRPDQALARTHEVLALGVGDYPSAVQGRLVGGHAALELGLLAPGPAPAPGFPAWRAAPLEWSALGAAHAGQTDISIAGFSEAAHGWAGNDVRSEVRCRWAAGSLAVAADRQDARELLLEAEAMATRYGLASMLVRIRRSLRSTGVVRRTAAVSGIAGLTGREEAVLELVAAGRTSSDIASQLGVQASTVESFVRSAMQKLGTSTRMAAGIRWHELRNQGPQD